MTQRRRKSNDKTPFAFPAVESAAGRSPEAATDTGMMNELVAASGRHDKTVVNKILFDLMARHEPLVMNVLRMENVPAHDREFVSAEVWKSIARIAGKPPGAEGEWNPRRGRDGGCPFVPLLRDVCSSRARDYHGTSKTQRRRHRCLEEAAATFGDEWQSLGGSLVRNPFPKKRGGNLKHTRPPASQKVFEVGRGMLAEAMASLPTRKRRMLELHAEGLNNEEIAEVVKTSPATVSRDLTQARETIRRLAEAAAG